MKGKVLVINPGSTSTKVALFENEECVAERIIRHTGEDIHAFAGVIEQTSFRKALIEELLAERQIDRSELVAVVGRGGLLKPIPGGTYKVDESMLKDLREERYNTHASNLGALLAHEIADTHNIDAYIVDPVVVDEFEPLARISGLAGIERRSVGHALNQKAVAREVAAEMGKPYEKSNLIVAHLGGGISIAAHRQGKMIDMVNGLDGEGPYSLERTGQLPLTEFARKIIDEQLNFKEAKKIIAGNGGLKSYLNETDIRIIEKDAQTGNEEAAFYLEGMCYQIAKHIGEMAVVLKGNVDAILLTGGISYSADITSTIQSAVNWIAAVKVVPGEKEMEALYQGVVRVLTGVEEAKNYKDY